jgi:putative ABC transport system substrate-binding protein
VFAEIGRSRVDALLVTSDPVLFAVRAKIRANAETMHLPAIYGLREYVEGGGLMSYGVSLPDSFRQAAGYVDKILRGAKPGDLAIEQPTKLEFVINVRTAKALGVIIPQSLILRADEVIQ